MKDIPIIFSAPMIQALLAGRKTQTRRILKPQPTPFPVDDQGTMCDVGLIHIEGDRLPRITTCRVVTTQEVRYAVGDRLWVRENIWQRGSWVRDEDETGEISTKWLGTSSVRMMADEEKPASSGSFVWRSIPSIHMPRWASRLTLIVEGVQIERLQEISEADAAAEGIEPSYPDPGGCIWRDPTGLDRGFSHASSAFEALWRHLHGPDAWDANPFVVALTFAVHRANIDALSAATTPAA